MSEAVRRIVTGIDPAGKSYIAEDQPAPTFHHIKGRPGTNLWATKAAPAPVDAPDMVDGYERLLPPAAGTVIRVMDIPPEPKDWATNEESFRSMTVNPYPDHDRSGSDKKRHPRMHVTQTIDYAVCLEGEIYAVMEQDETLMRAGDILIQRGTEHAWANRSDKPCRILFVLVDAASGETDA